MSAPVPLPVIVEPFSAFGDEIAGASADEIARNLLAATRTSLSWRCRARRPCPDLWTLFRGHALAPESRQALREVEQIYQSMAVLRPAAEPVQSEFF